jgi:hypothetical protein
MRALFVSDRVGTLRLTPAIGEIFTGGFLERDHQLVRRGRRDEASVDVFQECEPSLFRPPLDESETEDNHVIGIIACIALRVAAVS